jgi:Protein of unknown function (DUF2530)
VTRPRQPTPPPLEGNDQILAAVITVGWAIALAVLLAVRTDLPPSSRWWIWTCAAGIAVGIFGLCYMPVLKRSRARAAERRRAARQAG